MFPLVEPIDLVVNEVIFDESGDRLLIPEVQYEIHGYIRGMPCIRLRNSTRHGTAVPRQRLDGKAEYYCWEGWKTFKA